MARTKFEIQDSFENILRDLRRCAADAGVALREEMAVTVGDIIDHTPQDTGMAASGWVKAAERLGARHVEIQQGERYTGSKYALGTGKPRKLLRSAQLGRRLGGYEETVPFAALKRAVKTGNPPTRIAIEASNRVRHSTFLEYGVSAHAAAGGRGAKGVVEENGYVFAAGLRPMHIVRDAIRRMKQRIGPAFAKALRANIKHPKRYKKTVVA